MRQNLICTILNCGLNAYRKEALNEIDLYGEMNRFIPVLVSTVDYRVAGTSSPHHP